MLEKNSHTEADFKHITNQIVEANKKILKSKSMSKNKRDWGQ